MNTSVQNFSFQNQSVRIVSDNPNAPEFVAVDVAKVLGYSEPNRAIRQHCKGCAKYTTLKTEGGKQKLRTIQEPDLYRLIFGSKLESAVAFQDWVFEEVLPSIRKTGSYTAPNIATPEQKQHIKQLVGKYCFENGVDYRVMWNTLFNECGFNKLDNLTPQAYEKALAYFGVDGRRPERSNPSVSINRMDVENLSAFFKTFELIQSDFHFLLQLGNLIDSPRLVSLWSKIDHANFIYEASELALGRIKAQLPRLN